MHNKMIRIFSVNVLNISIERDNVTMECVLKEAELCSVWEDRLPVKLSDFYAASCQTTATPFYGWLRCNLVSSSLASQKIVPPI